MFHSHVSLQVLAVILFHLIDIFKKYFHFAFLTCVVINFVVILFLSMPVISHFFFS